MRETKVPLFPHRGPKFSLNLVGVNKDLVAEGTAYKPTPWEVNKKTFVTIQ